MIKEIKGNAIITFENEANVLIQQVNCKAKMASGFAKQIRNKYSKVYDDYMKFCKGKSSSELLGKYNITKVGEDKYVANIFGQLNYGRDKSVVYTNYEALKNGLQRVFDKARLSNYKIVLPKYIGCGLANGDWNIVCGVIKELDSDDIEIIIVEYCS